MVRPFSPAGSNVKLWAMVNVDRRIPKMLV